VELTSGLLRVVLNFPIRFIQDIIEIYIDYISSINNFIYDKIIEFMFKYIIQFIFYLGVVLALILIIFSSSPQRIVDLSRQLVTFNVTFSIGFAAVLCAIMTVFQKNQRSNGSDIRLMLNNLLLFNGVNLLLLMLSFINHENLNKEFKEALYIIELAWLCFTVLATIYLIFKGRGLLNKIFSEKN